MLLPIHYSLGGLKCIVRIEKYQLKDQAQGITPMEDMQKVKFVLLQQIPCIQTPGDCALKATRSKDCIVPSTHEEEYVRY